MTSPSPIRGKLLGVGFDPHLNRAPCGNRGIHLVARRLPARILPYLDLPPLGPVNSFGLLAMLGAFFGLTAGSRHAERLGLDLRYARRMAMFCGVGGVLGAHYLDLFLYQPGWADKPDAVWRFLNPFAGISSYGGLIGGTVGFFLFTLSRRGIKKLRHADAAMVGVVVLMTFGRAGCASVHDHVGVASNFALAVDFPAKSPSGVVGPTMISDCTSSCSSSCSCPPRHGCSASLGAPGGSSAWWRSAMPFPGSSSTT